MSRSRFHTFDQFAQALREEPVPPAPAEPFERRAAAAAAQRGRKLGKRSIAAVCALLLIATLTTAFAAAYGLKLRNAEGEILYEFGHVGEEQVRKDRQAEALRQRYASEIERLRAGLAPGEAASFLVVEAYELDGYVFDVRKEATYDAPERLRAATGFDLPLPSSLPDGVKAKRIAANFIGTEKPDGAALYEEAKANGKPFLAKKYDLSDDVRDVRVSYGTDKVDNLLNLYIRKSSGVQAEPIASLSGKEVAKVAGTEAAYDAARNSLLFVVSRDGFEWEYLLIGMAPGERWISKEELIATAESILDP